MRDNEQKYIVFCEEHHYNPLGVVRSLGEYGINPIVIAYGGRESVVTASKYVGEQFHVCSIEDGFNLLMEKYAGTDPKPIVFTCDDKVTSYLDERYDTVHKWFLFNNAGEAGRITYFMNKKNITDLVQDYGINGIHSIPVKHGEIPNDLQYPVFTKDATSIEGGWKKDAFICNNQEDLEKAYETITAENILLQDFIDKKAGLCFEGFAINKGKNIYISMESLSRYNVPGTYSVSLSVNNCLRKELIEIFSKVFEAIEYEGIFSIDFLIGKDDKLYFLEINFRNSAFSYASTKLGMNLPVLWAYGMINNEVPDDWEKTIPYNYNAIAEFQDYRLRVKTGKIGIMEWFRELKNSDCLFYYNKKDPKPFFIALFSSVQHKVQKIDRIIKKT